MIEMIIKSNRNSYVRVRVVLWVSYLVLIQVCTFLLVSLMFRGTYCSMKELFSVQKSLQSSKY